MSDKSRRRPEDSTKAVLKFLRSKRFGADTHEIEAFLRSRGLSVDLPVTLASLLVEGRVYSPGKKPRWYAGRA